jgi:multidrug efflux pump subunit AcrA (membrane-fusion protein)
MNRMTAPPATDLSRLRIDRTPGPPRSRRTAGRILLLVVPLILIVSGLVLWRQRAAAVPVKVVRAEVRGGGAASAGGITADGYVVARTKASVASKISGRLEYLGVSEGSQVEKGEVIARLESADYAAVLSQARADLARARAAHLEARAERDQLRRDNERMQTLLRRGMISRQQAESTASQLAAAEARVEVQGAQTQAEAA